MQKIEIVRHDPLLSETFSILHYQQRNILGAIVGRPGAGKTYIAMRFGELYDDKWRITTREEAQYIVDTRIVTEPKDFAKVIVQGERLNYGSVLIVDEAGISMPYESWQSLNNRLMSQILQSFRNRRLFVIFTLPNLKFLSIQARRLLNLVITATSIDRDAQQNICKIKKYQPNPETGKIYQHRPRYYVDEELVDFKKYVFNKPSDLLCEVYEEKAKQFKAQVAQEVFDKMDAANIKKPEIPKIDYKQLALTIMAEYDKEYITVSRIMLRFDIPEHKAKIVKSVVKDILMEQNMTSA